MVIKVWGVVVVMGEGGVNDKRLFILGKEGEGEVVCGQVGREGGGERRDMRRGMRTSGVKWIK